MKRKHLNGILIIGMLMLLAACNDKKSSATNVAPAICGCMDTTALNYNAKATTTDSTQCHYAIDSVTGKYIVMDTTFAPFVLPTGGGVDTIVHAVTITVTRMDYRNLHFDSIVICNDCYPVGGIGYSASSHSFYYSGTAHGEYGSQGDGKFIGDTLTYYAGSWSSYGGTVCNYHRGRGIKQH